MDHPKTPETISMQMPGREQKAAPPLPHKQIAEDLKRYAAQLEELVRRYRVRP